MISAAQSNIDQVLTNVSVEYGNKDFIAEDVFGRVPTEGKFGKYPTYGTDDLVPTDDRRSGAALSDELKLSINWDGTFSCDGHAKHTYVPSDSESNQAPSIHLQEDATRRLTRHGLLNREVNLVKQLEANLSPTDLSQNAGASAWDQTAVDPIGVLLKAKDAQAVLTGLLPTRLALGPRAWTAIINNPNTKARVSGALNGIEASKILPEQMAALLGLEKVLVASAIQKTKAGGPGVAGSYIWKDDALLYYYPDEPGLLTPALGYMLTWTRGVMGTEVYSEYELKRHSMWIEWMRYYDPRLISQYCGTMWTNTVKGN